MNDRTMIAAMCLTGLATGRTTMHPDMAKLAVQYADALMRELGVDDFSAAALRASTINGAIEDVAQLVEQSGRVFLTHEIAEKIRALKKSEVK